MSTPVKNAMGPYVHGTLGHTFNGSGCFNPSKYQYFFNLTRQVNSILIEIKLRITSVFVFAAVICPATHRIIIKRENYSLWIGHMNADVYLDQLACSRVPCD